MPIYEFRCQACDANVDRLLPIAKADEPGPCPECEGKLERQFSRVAVRYDSWGFNATDSLVPDRPGRNDLRTVRDKAEQLSED
ncbi:MAG: zinc ribbon domain-containing protein [Nitriliruptorales bacterium]|nr:zinc ribbon domain-containing protein [Nitriliruptorales bacterium]